MALAEDHGCSAAGLSLGLDLTGAAPVVGCTSELFGVCVCWGRDLCSPISGGPRCLDGSMFLHQDGSLHRHAGSSAARGKHAQPRGRKGAPGPPGGLLAAARRTCERESAIT